MAAPAIAFRAGTGQSRSDAYPGAGPDCDLIGRLVEQARMGLLDSTMSPRAGRSARLPGGLRRIVVINDFAVPEGGAGILALESVRQYRRLGYAVTFMTGQAVNDDLAALDVEVVGLNSRGLLQLPTTQAIRHGLNNAAAETMLADWIRRRDSPATVYHLHNWSQILSPVVYRALRPVADRTVVTCHDFFNACPIGSFTHFGKSQPCDRRPLSIGCLVSQCDRRSSLHKYWRTARYLYLRSIAALGDAPWTFVTLHDRMREKFLGSGFPARDLVTIPNPAVPWSVERVRAERNSGFLFVGRIGRDKGADVAVAAAERAGQSITLLGTGELQPALDERYRCAHFAGWCAQQDIVRHASAARALIVPSRVIEPFGLVICEAAMSGLPVLVSDRAYLADDIQALGFGRRFGVNDPIELAGLLSAFAGDDAAVEQMSRRAFKEGWRLCHSPESWIGAYVDLFERKLSEAG